MRYLNNRNIFTAACIALLIALWLLSGLVGGDSETGGDTSEVSIAERRAEDIARHRSDTPTRVQVDILHASLQTRQIVLRGKTSNKRTVRVKTELSGRVTARPVERGSRVEAGDTLCVLGEEDRRAQLKEAEAALSRAELEYRGAVRLQEGGLQSETAIAQAKAALESAQAVLELRQLNLQKTRLTAPFDALVEETHLEVGDYANVGSECVTLLDLDPMLLVADVAEQDVGLLHTGQSVSAHTVEGREIEGEITFIAHQSAPDTRTYRIEAVVDNADYSLRSGMTTRIRVPLEQTFAQLVSPGLFTLNDSGELGVRTVNDEDIVEFHTVELIREASDGVWVTGLPPHVRLITVGHEMVLAGEKVIPVEQYPSVASQ